MAEDEALAVVCRLVLTETKMTQKEKAFEKGVGRQREQGLYLL